MKQVVFIVAVVYLFVLPVNSYAYLDPGTGSYMAQILIASLLGAGYVLRSRLTWLKDSIKNLFSSRRADKTSATKKK